MCTALDIPDVPNRPQFLDNRLRIQNAVELDNELQAAIETFDYEELMRRFEEIGATAAPCYNVAEIFEDEHYKARENIVPVEDDELGGPIRMQNVVGKLSRNPGNIRHAGPPLGAHNREILMEKLGFTEEELKATGYKLE